MLDGSLVQAFAEHIAALERHIESGAVKKVLAATKRVKKDLRRARKAEKKAAKLAKKEKKAKRAEAAVVAAAAAAVTPLSGVASDVTPPPHN